MSYQTDLENLKEVQGMEEETTFFSNTNKLRMFGLFLAGVIATCVVLVTKGAVPVTKVSILEKKSGETSVTSAITPKEVFGTPTSVEGMLNKYGLTFDRSKVFKKKYASSYGKFIPKKFAMWGSPSKTYFYASTRSDTACKSSIPYSVMGMALNECMPLGAATDDDYTSQMGVVLTCDGSVTMNIFQDQMCSGEAMYSFTLANADACYSSSAYSTYVSCTPMDISNYEFDIQKVWVATSNQAGKECEGSTDAATFDSEYFELFPTNQCVPESITQSSYSFMATSTGDDAPAVVVYNQDNCQGVSETMTLETNCDSGEIKEGVYESTKYAHNSGNNGSKKNKQYV